MGPDRQLAASTAWRRGVALGLVLVSFLVYLTNLRPMGAIDTLPARYLPFSIVRAHDLDLDEFRWIREGGELPPLVERDGHWHSRYPVATPLLIAPLAVPAAAWLRAHAIADDDVRFRVVALIVERLGAALIAALSVAAVYAGACLLTTSGTAAAVAAVYAFGTGTWAISSQALWQHGLAELCLAALSVCLLRPPRRGRVAAAGALAALAVAGRPTMAIFALLALLYVARRRVRDLPIFLLAALPIALLLLRYNMSLTGMPTGGYVRIERYFNFPDLTSLAGLLVSPNRGLLVYTPAAALALVTLVLRPRRLSPWIGYLFAGLAAYPVFYAGFEVWWGGNIFGPRFLTDCLPALALCAVPAVDAWKRAWPGRLALAALAAWGVAVQVLGVYCDDGAWNVTPYTVTYKPERVWDWRDLQLVRAARSGWHGGALAPLLAQTVTATLPEPPLLRPLPAEALAGEIAVSADGPLRAARGARLPVAVRYVNRGAHSWPAFSDFGFRQVVILARWSRGGQVLEDIGELVALPRNVPPGATDATRAAIETPAQPGRYELELLIVQELDRTQGVFGGAQTRVAVQVD